MKTLIIVLILIVAVASACAPAQPTDPASVMQAFYDALTAGDVDEAMSYVADDAKFILFEVHIGKTYARDIFQEEVDRNSHFELSDLKLEGDTVTWNLKRTSGPLVYETIVEAVVQDGKIVSYTEDV